MRHGEHLRLAGRGTGGRTQLEIVHEVGYSETARDDGNRQQRMFQGGHVVAGVMFIFWLFVLTLYYGFASLSRVEYLVKAVPARVDLKRIREHDEDGDGQLPHSDEERSGGVHGDDVRANLEYCLIMLQIYALRPSARTLEPKVRYPKTAMIS